MLHAWRRIAGERLFPDQACQPGRGVLQIPASLLPFRDLGEVVQTVHSSEMNGCYSLHARHSASHLRRVVEFSPIAQP